MTQTRKSQVSLDATPYYHCMTRCVRHAYLCGEDPITGKSYEYRRQWIEDRILALQDVFSIDVCAYAVMNNHYHVVLHVDSDKATAWNSEEVIKQWHSLFKGHVLSHRYIRGESLNKAEQNVLNDIVETWRGRLMDISWFIRCVNEYVAREANAEDGCTGRFWEGRFKSQALLDEKALAACMAYVDLNPIRAKMATTPEQSDYTSVKLRAEKAKISTHPNHRNQQPSNLFPFVGNPRKGIPTGLPFKLKDYLELVDWTGRYIRDDKPGAIPSNLPPILSRLEIDPKHWVYMSQHFESKFKRFVGTVYNLKKMCREVGLSRTPGLSSCKALLGK